MNTNKRLLLFDIDGTLVSVERAASRQMLRDVLAEVLDIPIAPDFVWELGGKTDFQIVHEIAAHFQLPAAMVDERREFIKESLTKRTEPLATPSLVELLEGVQELVHRLSERDDVTLGLLTGNIKQTAYLKLRPYSLEGFFSFGAFGCDHVQRTELPPIAIHRANTFVHASNRNYISPSAPPSFTLEKTMIIGDTLNDIACARAHAIPVLAVATGAVSYERLAEAAPEFLVHDFSDTAGIVKILTH